MSTTLNEDSIWLGTAIYLELIPEFGLRVGLVFRVEVGAIIDLHSSGAESIKPLTLSMGRPRLVDILE